MEQEAQAEPAQPKPAKRHGMRTITLELPVKPEPVSVRRKDWATTVQDLRTKAKMLNDLLAYADREATNHLVAYADREATNHHYRTLRQQLQSAREVARVMDKLIQSLPAHNPTPYTQAENQLRAIQAILHHSGLEPAEAKISKRIKL